MAEVLLFHHLHGLTPGVRSFAETLEQAGHTVYVPDPYEGRIFESFDEGAAYAEQVGFDTIIERGRAAAEILPSYDEHAVSQLTERVLSLLDGIR